ncbi:MAG: serine protease [Acidimicrobiales bacterium]|nr:serine protease [Acidimicrobiales bacterium]
MSQIDDHPTRRPGAEASADDAASETQPVTDPAPEEPAPGDVDDGPDAADAGSDPWDGYYEQLAREQDAPAPVRKSRAQLRREWRQSDRARRYAARRSVRFPIFTRSVVLWCLLFALVGMAFGASGAFWWANFNTQVAELREDTEGFEERSLEAQGEIETLKNDALTQINEQLKPLAPYLAEARTIQLAETFAPYVWFVATLDEEGQPSVGSAFAVASDDDETLMVTSYATVRAATVSPAPEIFVRKNGEQLEVPLVSVDPERDLALLRVPRGGIQVLEWAGDEVQATALGSRVFPVSGLGGAGATLTSGIVVDQSVAGLLHTAPVGTAARGGPIVTADGKLLGVASLDYFPLGFDPGEIHYAVQINSVCEKLLDCGGGTRKERSDGGALPAPAPGNAND